jgi:hypothetical protein
MLSSVACCALFMAEKPAFLVSAHRENDSTYRYRLRTSHPSRKNKDAARMEHPYLFVTPGNW